MDLIFFVLGIIVSLLALVVLAACLHGTCRYLKLRYQALMARKRRQALATVSRQ
jgi:uncharacterized protein HemY